MLHFDTSLYSASYEEEIAVDEAVFLSTVRDEHTRIKYYFVENIHYLPNLYYPICNY